MIHDTSRDTLGNLWNFFFAKNVAQFMPPVSEWLNISDTAKKL